MKFPGFSLGIGIRSPAPENILEYSENTVCAKARCNMLGFSVEEFVIYLAFSFLFLLEGKFPGSRDSSGLLDVGVRTVPGTEAIQYYLLNNG